MAKELTLHKLKNLLVLKEDGEFYWKVDLPRRAMHTKAGTLRKDGYTQIQIEGKAYLKHRLVHFYNTGEWPERKEYAKTKVATSGG